MGGTNSVVDSKPRASSTPSTSSVTAQANKSKYNVKVNNLGKEATVNEEVTFTVSLERLLDQRESEITDNTVAIDKSDPHVVVILKVLADNTSREATVECISKIEQCKYAVSYTPTVRGRYIIIINVDGRRVLTKDMYVHCPPKCLAKSVPQQLSCTVHRPSQVVVAGDGSIYTLHISISSRTPEIAHFNRNGKQDKPITSKYKSNQASMFEFSNWNPKAIAVDDEGNVYIAHMNSLDKVTSKGELIRSINFEDTKTNPPEVMHCIPDGIRFHKDRLYVCNGYSNNVLIFDANLNLIRSLKTGRDSKNLQEPRDIDVDPDGNIYIADICAHKVFVYDGDGQYKLSIGSHGGREEGQLEKPVSLVVDSNHIYVAEETTHRISVFSIKGDYVCSFHGNEDSVSHLHYPTGIAKDRDGFIYLCDRKNGVLKF